MTKTAIIISGAHFSYAVVENIAMMIKALAALVTLTTVLAAEATAKNVIFTRM